MPKLAVYGVYETKAKLPAPQRYRKWIYHRKGPKAEQKWYKRRVWKKPLRMKKIERKGRYEFTGSAKDLRRAVAKAHEFMPRGYVEVEAEEFLAHPEKYGVKGKWVEVDVESL